MIQYVYLVVAAIGFILLMAVGAQILQVGTDEVPVAEQNSAAVNATSGTLELMVIGPAMLPYGLFLLAIGVVFLGFLKVKA